MLFRTTRFWTAQLVALFLVAGFSLACDSLPAGPAGVFNPPDTTDATNSGAMQAVITDSPGSSGGAALAGAAAAFSGTMTGRGDVEVSTNNKTWYTMGAPRDFSLELQAEGVTAQLTASTDIPIGNYRFVRINWSQARANLQAGSRVGSMTLTSNVSLRLGDASTAVMHQEVDAFELAPGAQARIVVDLNSEKWMKEEFVEAQEIRKEDFEDQAKISIVAGN